MTKRRYHPMMVKKSNKTIIHALHFLAIAVVTLNEDFWRFSWIARKMRSDVHCSGQIGFILPEFLQSIVASIDGKISFIFPQNRTLRYLGGRELKGSDIVYPSVKVYQHEYH